jgi:polyferredoxin
MSKVHINELEKAKKWAKFGKVVDKMLIWGGILIIVGVVVALFYAVSTAIGLFFTSLIFGFIVLIAAVIYVSSKVENAERTIRDAERYGVLDE